MRNLAGHCGGSVALAKIGRLPVSPAVDLQAFSVVEFKKTSNWVLFASAEAGGA